MVERIDLEQDLDFQKIKQTLQHVHDDTRQAITNLKYSSNEEPFSWTETIYQYVTELKNNYLMDIKLEWGIQENTLSAKEKIELFTCIKEAVVNVIKHAKTNQMWIHAKEIDNGWICEIKDRGIGFTNEVIHSSKGYGLQIMKERAERYGMGILYEKNRYETIIEFKKGEQLDATFSNINR